MICAICFKRDSKFCTRCKTVGYCCKEHQRQDWPRHRDYCNVFKPLPSAAPTREVSCVLVEDTIAKAGKADAPLDWAGWEDCLVPQLLGIPLKVKSRVRPLSFAPRQQISVYFMVNPADGFAPKEWQLGPLMNRGVVAFARTDNVPFDVDLFYEIYDFIYGYLMDLYPLSPEIARKHMTPRKFEEWQKRIAEEKE